MNADTVSVLVSSAFHKLDEAVSECVQKLHTANAKITALEKENAELKKKLSNINTDLSPRKNSLVDEATSSNIDVSLAQLKDILNLRKK